MYVFSQASFFCPLLACIIIIIIIFFPWQLYSEQVFFFKKKVVEKKRKLSSRGGVCQKRDECVGKKKKWGRRSWRSLLKKIITRNYCDGDAGDKGQNHSLEPFTRTVCQNCSPEHEDLANANTDAQAQKSQSHERESGSESGRPQK